MDFFTLLHQDLEQESTAELEHKRYKVGSLARQDNYYSIMAVRIIDRILLGRI